VPHCGCDVRGLQADHGQARALRGFHFLFSDQAGEDAEDIFKMNPTYITCPHCGVKYESRTEARKRE
jgi:hypothetical protein